MAKAKKIAVAEPAAAPVAPMSAKDRLASKARQQPLPSTSKKKARDTISLGQTTGDAVSDEESKVIAEAVDRLCAAAHAEKAIKGHQEAARALVLPFTRLLVLTSWAEEGRKLDNPKFVTPSGSSFILQCKDTLSGPRGFRAKGSDGRAIPVADYLRNYGVPDDLIEVLEKANEFKEEILLTINMPKLEKEKPAIASRLMDLILAANEGGVTDKDGNKIKFSDEELGMITERKNEVTVKDGFLERSISHVKSIAADDKNAAARLDVLLTAVAPQWAVSQAFCADPDKGILKLLHEKVPEKVTTAEEIAKPSPPVNHTTADGKHTLRVEGLIISIVRNSDKKEMGKKTCKDTQHLANSVRKWTTDPAALAVFIAENV